MSAFIGTGIQNFGSGNLSIGRDLTIGQDISNKTCLADLRVTDPRDDKSRIEVTKGGLLKDSYRWILEHKDFKRWQDNEHNRLLWIRGNPGKGKTMLLCGIIDELSPSTRLVDGDSNAGLSYFFCQATDTRINNATAVLRGLIYMLVGQQPALISHVRERYDDAGKKLFEDVNAWHALSKIFTCMVEDQSLQKTYVVIDALDECTKDLSLLLDLVVKSSDSYSKVNWIVSSRNRLDIEKSLSKATQDKGLSLELNEISVSAAVTTYIQYKVDCLAEQNDYDKATQDTVQRYLSSNASGTFLWASLVCEELSKMSGWEAEESLTEFPPGLDALYWRMMDQVLNSRNAKLCKSILGIVLAVYRPITLDELASFVDMPPRSLGNYKVLTEIIGHCGSFLTLRERTIFFVHQSAKDFLIEKLSKVVFRYEIEHEHYTIFSRSLQVLDKTLRRDIYALKNLGFPINRVEPPNPDPLVQVRYSCIYWVDHLYVCIQVEIEKELKDNGFVDQFLRQHYLHWLEALSLLRSMSEGILSMGKLDNLLQGQISQLANLVRDGRRFSQYHKSVIERNPLQIYASALIFSPTNSIIRREFEQDEPKWIVTKPVTEENWTACLQTFESHTKCVNSVAFSPDSKLVASASDDRTVKIWSVAIGALIHTLTGHTDNINSVAFSPDSKLVASASDDLMVKIWSVETGAFQQTLIGHASIVISVVFAADSKLVASVSRDQTVKVWCVATGTLLQTLAGHVGTVHSAAFSPDLKLVASASYDQTIKIWSAATGTLLQTLDHINTFFSVTFSPDSRLVTTATDELLIKTWSASTGILHSILRIPHIYPSQLVGFSPALRLIALGSRDRTIMIWSAETGSVLQTLAGHTSTVFSVAFSPDSKLVASASDDRTVRIWSTTTGIMHQTPTGHTDSVNTVATSPNYMLVASASRDRTVKIWSALTGSLVHTLAGHTNTVESVAFSSDSKLVASASYDHTVRIWLVMSGASIHTLAGHTSVVNSVAFSNDSELLASASYDQTVKIWSVATGALQQTLADHDSSVSSVAFSPDCKLVASSSVDQTVKIWSTGGALQQTLSGHTKVVNVVVFSLDSKLVASASYDRTVKIWSARTGALQHSVGLAAITRHLSFKPNGLTYCLLAGHEKIYFDSLSVLGKDLRITSRESFGYAISRDRCWISLDGENLLWLPTEFRPSSSVVFGSTIIMGCGTGRVVFIRLSTEPPEGF